MEGVWSIPTMVANATGLVGFSNPDFKDAIADLPDLTGKHVVVTGSSSGLGKASALILAQKGAHVVLACRSKSKTEAVISEIIAKCPTAKVQFMELDLSSLSSVRKFASAYKSIGMPLDVLMNNAGIMALPNFEKSVDGVEMQFATNHLGPFYLTKLLLPIIEETAKKNGSARIVNVSSWGHFMPQRNGVDLPNINNPKTYSPFPTYGSTKLANILFTRELQKRLDMRGLTNIYVNAVHPGVVASDLMKKSAYISSLEFILKHFLLTPDSGALTQLYVAAHPHIVERGLKAQFFVPVARLFTPSEYARDPVLAEQLFQWSEDVISSLQF